MKKVAGLNLARDCAACTVFEGKIVVTGGDNNQLQLKSIEAYDHYENKRTYLPYLIDKRCDQAAVSMGNRMFVIGGSYTTSSEIFSSFSSKFTQINSKVIKKHMGRLWTQCS